MRQRAEFASRVIEADDLMYVHRRHETNASAPHRKDMWQGVMPLQLAGAEAMAALYRAADGYATASMAEAFQMPLAEATAAEEVANASGRLEAELARMQAHFKYLQNRRELRMDG